MTTQDCGVTATYHEIRPDGADWLCACCQTRGPASDFWYIKTPDGKAQVLHKSCVDEDWFQYTTKGEPV